MIITLKYLRERFRTFNGLCFGGCLPEPRLRVGNARGMLGSVRYKKQRAASGEVRPTDITLTISAFYDLPERETDDTILHEMIHLYIICNRTPDSSVHGELFRKIMNDINLRFSRNITVSHKGALQQSRQKACQNIIAVSELHDGTFCITRASKTRIFRLNKDILRLYDIKSLKWYNTVNPFFNTFPRSIKPKFYRIRQDILSRELSGAIPLTIASSRAERTV